MSTTNYCRQRSPSLRKSTSPPTLPSGPFVSQGWASAAMSAGKTHRGLDGHSKGHVCRTVSCSAAAQAASAGLPVNPQHFFFHICLHTYYPTLLLSFIIHIPSSPAVWWVRGDLAGDVALLESSSVWTGWLCPLNCKDLFLIWSWKQVITVEFRACCEIVQRLHE